MAKYREPKKELQPHVITLYERELIQLLCPAIKSHHLIKFWYSDTEQDFEGWRFIEPHLIGQTKFKAANILLSGWFLPTTEEMYSGHMEKWGNYILDNVSKVEILPEKFTYTRIGYNSRDSRMTTIYCAT